MSVAVLMRLCRVHRHPVTSIPQCRRRAAMSFAYTSHKMRYGFAAGHVNLSNTFETLEHEFNLPSDAGDDAYLFRGEAVFVYVGEINVPPCETKAFG